MENNNKISIIIVNYNGQEFLSDCLESVLKSDYPSYEVILVDNNSSDESVNIVKNKFPQIKIIINKKNLGFAKANNIGIKQVSGDAIFLLNNDTIIHKDLVKILSNELFSSEQIGMVGPKIYFLEKGKKPDNQKTIWFAGGKINWQKATSWHIAKNQDDNNYIDEKKEVDFITGCALMIKKEVINKIGLLDEKFFAYYEDADWCLRAKKAGYKIIYIPFGGVWHIKSATASRYIFNKNNKKIKIIFEYLRNLNRLKYNKYKNNFIFYWRYVAIKYRIKLLINFIFIKTPIFIYSILMLSQISLIKIIKKHL
ncbi:MAG: glycosyltransferase family 2 protein [Patescibacteria group bacterium]